MLFFIARFFIVFLAFIDFFMDFMVFFIPFPMFFFCGEDALQLKETTLPTIYSVEMFVLP